MNLEAERRDREVGLWFTNCPYDLEIVTADDEPVRKRARGSRTAQSEQLVKRTYLCNISGNVLSENRHNLLLQYDLTLASLHPAKTYYRNGRHFYFVSNVDNLQELVPSVYVLPLTPDAVKQSASFPFNPMFKLICTGFRMADVLPYLREERNVCTEYGSKIAKSIIKIAATRIFAEPEQSIVELPVNSVDSYSALRAERSGVRGKTVGKFGMGFFSILYWLVDHEARSLTIESFHKGQRIYCVISQKQGELGFTLDIEHTNVPTDGLRVELNCKDDPFTDHNVEQFKKQLGKVRFIVSDLVAYRETEMDKYTTWNQTCQDTTNKIFVEINNSGIIVEDYAQGVSLETLLTKLFVPSVSTKTIQAGMTADDERKEEFHPLPSRIVPNGLDHHNFIILVQSVAVVTVPFQSESSLKYDVIVNMLSNVRIPVSRDDILLTDTTVAEFRDVVVPELLRDCLRLKNMAVFQLGLKAYIQYTTLSNNKQEFQKMLQLVTFPELIAVQEKYLSVLKSIPDVASYIIGAMSTEQLRLIALLDSIDNVDKTIFWNKKIFYVPDAVLNGGNVSNAGLSTYLFVSLDFVRKHALMWPQRLAFSTYTDRLILLNQGTVSTFVNVAVDQKYKEFIESRILPKPFDAHAPITNVLCQIVLKLQAVLDMYELSGIANFIKKRDSNGNTLDFDFLNRLSASATHWTYDSDQMEGDYKLAYDEVVLSIIDDLSFYSNWMGDSCLTYLYDFYDLISGLVDNLKSTFYGKRQPTLNFFAKHFIFSNQPREVECILFRYNAVPLSHNDFVDTLMRFPNLKLMVQEHIALTLNASLDKTSDYNLVMWTHLNPLYWVSLCEKIVQNCTNKEFRDMLKEVNESCHSDLFDGYQLPYIANFILFYLTTNPGYYKFFIVVVLFLHLPFKDFLNPHEILMFLAFEGDDYNFSIEDYERMKVYREKHLNHVMPLLVPFLEQFIDHNILDCKDFINLCLTTTEKYNFFVMKLNPMLSVLLEKLLTSFSLYRQTLNSEVRVLPLFSLEDLPNPLLQQTVYRFTTSKFIDFVLKHEWPESESLFSLVNRYQPDRIIPLQLTEIAINEGSAKSPMEAMIIETVQNSVDAIRLSERGEGVIKLYLKESETHYMFQITDFVGIPQKGLISLFIPFLSSKVASASVTGEMGSGFFNVYRESEQVIVHTTLNGRSTLVVDTPIKDTYGRVVDLEKHVSEFLTDRSNETNISVVLQKTNKSLITNITDVVNFVKSIISLIPIMNNNISITLNDDPLLVMNQRLVATASFESFYCFETTRPSFIFTKGVPFLPLTQFAFDLIPAYALPYIKNNIMLNIHHGVYTPVQTRSKITLALEVKAELEKFVTDTIYCATLYVIIEKATSKDYIDLNEYLQNFNSKSSLDQLIPYKMSVVKLNSVASFSLFMMNYEYNGLKSLSELIAMAHVFMTNKRWETLSDITKKAIRTFAKWEPLGKVLELWLTPKNTDLMIFRTEATSQLQEEGKQQLNKTIGTMEVFYHKYESLLEVFMTSFVNHYWICGREARIEGAFINAPPNLVIANYSETGVRAHYDGSIHSIFVNTNSFLKNEARQKAVKSFVKWLVYVKSVTDVQLISSNTLFDEFFKCAYPARTFPHEIEHARRGTNHTIVGAHDSVLFMIPGYSAQMYTFDEVGTKVFEYIAANTPFWEHVIHDVIAFRNTL